MSLPLALLGGLSPARFMQRHWQKKPLLVRQAIPGVQPPLDRRALFDLAAQPQVESRLIVHGPKGWSLKSGPVQRRALPPQKLRSSWLAIWSLVNSVSGAASAMDTR